MNYLLDTNICIYIIKRKPLEVLDKFRRISLQRIGVSSITLAELAYGVAKSRFPEKNHDAFFRFIMPITLVPFDVEDTRYYGQICHQLRSEGTPIGQMDMLIAAQALRHDSILVTNNTREFERIPELRLENWVT